MLISGALLVALSLNSPALARQETPAFQIRTQELLTGDGTRIEDVLLVVEGVRITRMEQGREPDAALPLIEHDGVVTAGMVVCQSQSGAAGEANDGQRAFLPEARLIHAFDPDHSDFEQALAAGITTLVLTPTGDNVVGGLTAVVKTHGGTVLTDEGHLALSFTGASLGQSSRPAFFFLEAEGAQDEPTAVDGGPENTESARRGSRSPTSYAGALRMLRERLGASSDPDGPYARATRGDLRVFIEAHARHEVLRAVSFAKESGLSGVLFGAPLVGDPGLLGPLTESGLGVVVGPYSVGQLTPSLNAVKALQEAGVSVAFALGTSGRDPEELRLAAALALSAGAEPAGVWRGLTSDAARLAGVDARVGALERGKDADFVLWSGDPLNLASHVEAVYVEGKLAYSANTDGGGSR